jgi:hypothetical protein
MEPAAAFSFELFGDPTSVVMPGLDPGIHQDKKLSSRGMDCRVKPGNDS